MTLILSFLQGHLKDKVRFQGELSAFTQGHGLQSQSSIPDFHSYRLALEESLGDFFFFPSSSLLSRFFSLVSMRLMLPRRRRQRTVGNLEKLNLQYNTVHIVIAARVACLVHSQRSSFDLVSKVLIF